MDSTFLCFSSELGLGALFSLHVGTSTATNWASGINLEIHILSFQTKLQALMVLEKNKTLEQWADFSIQKLLEGSKLSNYHEPVGNQNCTNIK